METASARISTRCHWWSHTKTVTLIWFISFVLFYSFFHMALQNSSQNYPSSGGITSHSHIPNGERRARLYDKMARDLDDHGAAFLKQGETSQSLLLSDIFTLKDGSVTPVHKNSSLYHFSMFHASHHISPVPATEDEIEAEATAVRAVAEDLCPLKIVLDRVILTSTGVLLGCWQVISGTDPMTIRAKLRTALPNAPEKQLEPHQLRFLHELVDSLNNQIRGSEAVVSELWYVEEYDVLALALDGRMKVRKFPLECSSV
ncbi:transmembrane protein [Citrus sinensis]|uniref:Transmembrane protein n=1 Tax=Citrus sinensis TaxID=2711 RepID=A0ACB8LQQ3_CITSI|nr:transmembrane protein [Citrus sinensis]